MVLGLEGVNQIIERIVESGASLSIVSEKRLNKNIEEKAVIENI